MPSRSELPDLAVQSVNQLRREISARNLALVHRDPCETTYGDVASVLFRAQEDGTHGNFFPGSYRAICANQEWAKRLDKTYTASRHIPRGNERTRSELDCAISSDALLMNIFCHPRVMQSRMLCSLLGVDHSTKPAFGVRVRTPLGDGHDDRTEVDMQLGDLLVEAKLSESNFQTARPALMERYERLEEVFDVPLIPQNQRGLHGYQLLRGVLAAEHHNARYAVLCDARRPDLREQWFRVMAAVKTSALRSRMLFVTWQEIAACLPASLQKFLATKYGIEAAR